MITFCGQSPFDPMNGEYKMCFRGHFRKDHAHGTGVTISSRGCESPEFRKEVNFTITGSFFSVFKYNRKKVKF